MTDLEKIKAFFNDNEVIRQTVSISKIEQLAGVYPKALYNFVKGVKYRSLSDEQIQKIIPIIKKIGFK